MSKKNLLIIGFVIVGILLFVIFFISPSFERTPEERIPEGHYTVHVSSEPEGAKFYVGEKGPFTTPATIHLPPKDHHLWLYKEDYYTVEKNIRVEDNMSISFELQKALTEDNDFEPQEVDPYPY